MNGILPYMYTLMWFAISVAMFLFARRNNFGKTLYIAGSLFAFMGIWWLIDTLLPDTDMLSGTYAWVFRIVVAVLILLVLLCYTKFKNNNK